MTRKFRSYECSINLRTTQILPAPVPCKLTGLYLSGYLQYNQYILTQKRNIRFTFKSVYSKRMQLFCSIFLLQYRWSFSNVMHQTKSIRRSLAPITTPLAAVPANFERSRVSSIFLNRRSTSVSHWTDTLLSCYEWQVYSCCHHRWHKSVT